MTEEAATNSLFERDGELRLGCLARDARETLEQTQRMLEELDRSMFLPLDLLITLIERGHDGLASVVAAGTDGQVESDDVLQRLRSLAREIEEEASTSGPLLERACFSRGFSRILHESWVHSEGRRRRRVTEADLVRSVMWRAEAVESASVRWAIRRLGEGGGDILFDKRGLLRSEVFAESMWSVLRGAMKIAAANGTPFLGTPHLIAMLCSVKDSIVWRSATARGLEPSRLREELLRLIGTKPTPIPEFHVGRKTLTPRMVRMLSYATREAGEDVVRETQIVEAFLDDGGSSLELVQALGLESEIRKALGEPKVLAEALPVEAAIELGARRHSTPTLDMLGRDLTEEALEGKLPEIVGRETELQRVVNVLLRKEQRNPLLTGEAGVGKTALAVALAQRIASGKVPRQLRGHRLVEINGASLMSGTSYRGDLESRIKGLLEEASKEVILFIDEAHAVFAPRAGSHAPAEVPNHFKSALASGEIAVVAATTEAEYRRWFEQDPALKRRFERIDVGEPGADLVHDILHSVVGELQSEYDVVVKPDAVGASIDLSVRYLPEQRLPDKAKKLLMDACIARAHHLVENDATDEVTRADIGRQVHLKTGIPLDRILRGEINWWVGIEDRLNEQVVGQEEAIGNVARALVTGRLKRGRQHRPMSVLAFVGPPGIGKGTLARAVAEEIFGDPRALLRLDMTDFQEAHSMSRLIGSPPGYVGYEDEDMLVTPLRRRPSSVVLLEDFDRAHPRIQERLLRLLEEGEIADTRGYTADASNAIFILTVQTAAGRSARIGFGEGESGVRDALAEHDPGLADRLADHVDATILFEDLSRRGGEPARRLVDQRIDAFVTAMSEEYAIEVEIHDTLREEIELRVEDLRDAQSIDELVDSLLYSPITDAMLGQGCAPRVELRFKSEAVEIAEPAQD
jgi:ATP-dependent Clp protease ATP-binding subunit ClpC